VTVQASRRSRVLRVLVVDDHEVVRAGLRALLDSVRGLSVVGEAETAPEAVRAARQLTPDVVVMDYRLGDGSGIDACRDILAERPATRVLILTAFPDEMAAAAALRVGAAGFLLKRTTGDGLIQAVKGASSERIVDADVLGRMVSGADHGTGALSYAERELADLVAAGLTNAQIATRLGSPSATVKSQVSRLLARLGAVHRSELAARLAELVPLAPDARVHSPDQA
jgi:DNA-binding NarL/FixJ family response regulator